MSGAIVVPLTEMQQLAEQWRATITEMDVMVQHIARDIASVPDNGKGLNEVRSRGRIVGAHHQQLLVQGMAVQKQVVDSVQRFSQADQELAGMVRSVQMPGEGYYEYILRTTMVGSMQLQVVFEKASNFIHGINEQIKNADQYIEKMKKIYDDVNNILGGFLPEIPSDISKKFTLFKHITDEVDMFATGLRTGDFLPWWDTFTTNRSDELYTLGKPVFAPINAAYQEATQRVLTLSNMIDAIGFQDYNVVKPVLDKLPKDTEGAIKNSMKWLIMDMPTYIIEALDRQMGIHNSYKDRSW
jgi:hypothetical protein